GSLGYSSSATKRSCFYCAFPVFSIDIVRYERREGWKRRRRIQLAHCLAKRWGVPPVASGFRLRFVRGSHRSALVCFLCWLPLHLPHPSRFPTGVPRYRVSVSGLLICLALSTAHALAMCRSRPAPSISADMASS